MKRFYLLLVMLLTLSGVKAMDYTEARDRAWFLTDKMAYELNLTPDQYDRAYQINLDYLMSVRTASDCLGYGWRYRDADLRCILFDWQYTLYSSLEYFFRPLRWVRSAWYYPVCEHYRVGYYYFNRPSVYVSYRGGMWNRRGHNDVSPYHGMHFAHSGGMRDRYHSSNGRPDYRPAPGRPADNAHGDRYNNRRPETRPDNHRRPDRNESTVGNNGRPDANRRPGGNVSRPSQPTRPDRTSRPSRGNSGSTGGNRSTHTGRSFGR